MAKVMKKAAKKGTKTTAKAVARPAKKAAKVSTKTAAARPVPRKAATGTTQKYGQSGAPWWKQYLPS